MTDDVKKSPSWLRRCLIALVLILLLLAIIAVSARLFITSNSGARFIENQVNKRSFGPIEQVEISGFSGDPLDVFSIDAVKLYDKEGLWLSAQYIDIDWSPWPLRKKVLDIRSARIASTEVLRRPVLNEVEPPEDPFTIQLEKGDVKALTIREPVIGQEAVLSLSGRLTTEKDSAIKAALKALRTDAAGDALSLGFTRTASGEMSGEFTLNGAEDGTIATLLRAPDGIAITGLGSLNGDMAAGQGNIIIKFNDTLKITAQGRWTASEANVTADVNTQNWALFDQLRRGLGDDLDVTAKLNRAATPAKFDVNLSSNRLTATASGQLNPEGGLPKTVDMSARSENLGAILPLPDGYTLAAGKIEGRAQLEPAYTFEGSASLQNITTPFGEVSSIQGPIKLTQISDAQYNIESEIKLSNVSTEMALPITLAPETTLQGQALLNTQSQTVTELKSNLASGTNTLQLSGKVNYGAPSFDISGAVGARLNPLGALPPGRLQSDFQLRKTDASLPTLSANGAFKPDTAIAAPFDQLLAEGVNFDVNMAPVPGGLRINAAKLLGENIRAAMSGQITDTLNVEGEALLSAPFTYEPVALSGETAASFTVTGTRSDPNLRLDARADEAVISGYTLENARLRTEINDLLKTPKGPLRVTADTPQGELDIAAHFASQDQIYIADDIAISWGRLTASGNISKPVTGPAAGELRLNLPEKGNQYARANLTLSTKGDAQGISLDVDAANIAYGSFAFDSFTASAEGTLTELTGRIETKGQRQLEFLERQFSLKAPFSFARRDHGVYVATLDPDAKYGNIFFDAGPRITARYDNGDTTVTAPMTISGNPLGMSYENISGVEQFILKAENQPVTLIPMPGNLADTRGRIAADIKLSSGNSASGVTGGGTITLSDWRGFDEAQNSGVSGDFTLNMVGRQLNWSLQAQTPGGFTATSKGYLPITNAKALAELRPNMTAPLSGQFTASGPATAILGLITPSDSQPSGQLSANLTLSGTAESPLIEGQASGKSLHMEAPQLGTRLSNGRFTANFTNDSLSVSDVYVSDKNGGSISGQGDFKLGEFARPIGSLDMTADNFRALDRKDFESRVSGRLAFESTQDKAIVTGDVILDRAEVKQFVTGGAAVVEIPVEEINKPDALKPIEVKAPATPISLDVRVRAPRRIFVRSKGLDVELAVDATIRGTLTAPEVYGEANVLRGGYKIAGKELAFETGGIKFDGELGAAQVNLVATTNTQNLSATVTIKGTVADPEIELSSTPDRPQDEILSALLFGRSATELSTIEAAQLAGALAQFSGAGGGFDLMGGLRDALGVGQLSIGVSEDGGAQITGGRYLAKNVYLQVFSGGGTGQTGAVIDWEIRKNISLRSQVQADNEQSFSLKWKRDF